MTLVLTATMSQQPVFAKPSPAKLGPVIGAAAPNTSCPPSRPDKASAMFAARRCGGRVEVLGLRTERRLVWAERDGSFTEEQAVGVVRFQRDGRWVDVDLTLVKQPNGSVAPKAHPGDLKLSAAAGHGVHQLAALGGSGLALTFDGSLPEPVLSGTKATYPEVYPGIDLVIEVTTGGFEQTFVVKERAAVGRVAGALRAVKLTGPAAESDTRGGVLFKDPSGKVIGRSPEPVMWDAVTDPLRPGEPVNMKSLGLSIGQSKRDAAVTADQAWLNDPARRFPITVDPYLGQNTGFDTYVATGTTTDLSTWTKLALGTANSGATKRIAYVNFTAADMPRAKVNWASLKLWGQVASSCENGVWRIFGTVTNAYEYTTWDHRPDLIDRYGNNIGKDGSQNVTGAAPFGESVQPSSGGCTGQWIEGDATDLFQYAANQTWSEFTAALVPYWDDTNVYYKEFKSNESGTYPHVTLNYNDPPSVESVSTEPGVPCVTGANRPYVTTKRPKLQATVTDSDTTPANVTFEWFRHMTFPKLGSQTVNNVPSGSVASATVPEGAFSDGGTYMWRVKASDPSGQPESLWSSWCEFTVDVTKPGTPIVSTKDGKYPSTSVDNTWGHGGYGQAGVFTITPGAPSGDLASFTYQLDSQPSPTTVNATAAVDITITPTEDGVRTLTVTAKDKAGNVSNPVKYVFNVGRAGLSQPRPGANVNKRANLAVDGDTTYTRVRFEYRRGPGARETPVPWSNMTTAANQPVTGAAGTPIAISGLGGYGVWNAVDTLGSDGGVAQVRARLYKADGFVADKSIRHLTANQCIDAQGYGTANGTQIQAYQCLGGGNQQWELGPDRLIRNPASGRCLDIFDGGTANNTPIKLWDCHGGWNQQFERLADGQIRNPNSGKCLNIQGGAPYTNGQHIILWDCISAENMRFQEIETPYTTQWITINVDPNGDGAATSQVGPGSVNLLTGDLELSSADVSQFGVGVGRALSTRDTKAGWVPQKERLSTAAQQATDLTSFWGHEATVSIVTNRGQGGSSESLQVDPAASGPTSGDTFASVGGDTGGLKLGMQPGRRYRAAGWIYVPASTGLATSGSAGVPRGMRIVAFVKTPSAGYIEIPSPKASFVDGWQQLTLDFTVPGDATEAFIRLYNGMPAGQPGKVVFWDNLSVREITAPFGPQWFGGSGGGPAQSTYTTLEFPAADLAKVIDASGSYLTFGRSSSGFFPQPGAESLTLKYIDATHYELSDDDGTVVEFTEKTAGKFVVTRTWTRQSASTTTYSYDVVDDRALLKRVIAATETGIGDCAAVVPAKGCRVLEYDYATATTATASAFGDIAGQVRAIKAWSWDPAASAVTSIEIGRYAYDPAGQLRETWDPRLGLKTAYEYAANGVITKLTPPGQVPWEFTYTTVPGDTGPGRLAAVKRGSATSTVVYRVPLSGAGAPFDMSLGNVSRWSTQPQLPTDGTAIYPPTQVPDGNQAAGTMPSSWARASVSYLDANGRPVGELAPGGHLSATWYDQFGNVVQELTAGNRKRALDASATDSAADEALLAQSLSTLHTFNPDGVRKLKSSTPTHKVQGQPMRVETAYTYDEGSPATGDVYDLVTTEVTRGAGNLDPRTEKTEYDWVLEQPTKSIVDPGGLGLATSYAYDGQGRRTTQTPPAGPSRVTVFYSVGANAAHAQCGNRPEWAGLVCLTKPGSQPSTGPQLPITTTTYNRYLQPAIITESTPAAGTLRTTTITYDGAGRASLTTVSASGLGQALETRRALYDNATGQLAKTQTLDPANNVTAEIVRTYDTLGRLTSYKDGDGNITTTTYDVADRPVTVNDGKATRTYTYNGTLEPRGMATSVVDSNVGNFTGTYDADGNLVTQTWPNGVNVTTTYNEIGVAIGITYTQPGCGLADCTLYTETNTLGVHGNVTSRVTSFSSQAFGYDKAGRITSVADTVSGQCTTRAYTFDATSNRTGRTTYGPGTAGVCQTTTPAGATTWTYDGADRVTTAGYTYDALGRTLSMPGEDTAAGTAGTVQLAYHANDMVRTIVSGDRTATYTLDVLSNRIRSWTDNGVTKTNHFTTDADSPAWTDEGEAGKYTRAIAGVGGVVAVHTPAAGELYVIANLHGDFVAGMAETGYGLAYVTEYNENGMPRNTSDVGARRYGWLGSDQRASDTPGGLILMGVRLYAPGSGRFLSTDPVYGGNANAYEYCAGDGVGCSDTTGQVSCRRTRFWVKARLWGKEIVRGYRFRCNLSNREVIGVLMGLGAFAAILAAAGAILAVIPGAQSWAAAVNVAARLIAAAAAVLGVAYFWRCRNQNGIWFDASAQTHRLVYWWNYWVVDWISPPTRVGCR